MVSYFRAKDNRIRNLACAVELTQIRLSFFLRNSNLSLEEKQKLYLLRGNRLSSLARFSTRRKNRCVLTTRSGAVFRHFRLSRIMLKEFAAQGF